MSLKVREDEVIEEAADFVLLYGGGLYTAAQRPIIEEFIERHMGYGTLMIVRIKGEIVGMARYNFPEWDTVTILDLIIRPDHRNRTVMKSMLIQGLMTFPQVKRMSFKRKKHDKTITCLIDKFLGVKHGKR